MGSYKDYFASSLTALKKSYKDCFVSLFNQCEIVMSHIGWEGEQTTIYKGVETFPKHTHFKAKGKPERESPKRTIFASGESG